MHPSRQEEHKHRWIQDTCTGLAPVFMTSSPGPILWRRLGLLFYGTVTGGYSPGIGFKGPSSGSDDVICLVTSF
jgi:hypothetical protein